MTAAKTKGTAMTKPDSLTVAAVQYAIAEGRVLRFEGNRSSVEYDALKLAWEAATIALSKEARKAGIAALDDFSRAMGYVPPKKAALSAKEAA
jgi:hypothetical protein